MGRGVRRTTTMSSPQRASGAAQNVCMPLTLMAVHAHPDDECSSTGGVLAKYAAEGVRTIVVTCTNGELGDGPGGIKPGDPGHDTEAVAATRRAGPRQAGGALGGTHGGPARHP